MTIVGADGATASKVRKTITLDRDLAEAYEQNLSAAVNGALRDRLEVDQRTASLGRWLDELADRRGPVDEEEYKRAMDALQ